MTKVIYPQEQMFASGGIGRWLSVVLLGLLLLGNPVAARDLSPVSVEPVAEGRSPWGESGQRPAAERKPAASNTQAADTQTTTVEDQPRNNDWPNLYADAPPAPVHRAADEPSLKEVLAAIESLERAPRSRGPLLEKELWIPIVAILMIFGGPILLVIVLTTQSHKARESRERQRADTINRMLDAGKDIPVELLRHDAAKGPDHNLRKGLENIGMGVGLLLFLTFFLGIGIGSVGFIQIGWGLSQLAVWKWVDSKTPPTRIDQDQA